MTTTVGRRRHPHADCGHLSAYSDETIRQRRYGIAAVIICGCRQKALRRYAESLRMRSQRSWHMTTEGGRRRRQILSSMKCLELRYIYVEAKGSERNARRECWDLMIPRLLDMQVNALWIEKLDGRQPEDKADISDVLAKKHAIGKMSYEPLDKKAEPLLWYADAAAWSTSARSPWPSYLKDLRI